MKKITLTLEMTKELLKDEENLFASDGMFKTSVMAKAIKKKTAEHAAIVFIYKNTENWSIREYCIDHCGFNYKEAALCGFLSAVDYEEEWCEMFSRMENFFESKDDFVGFVKDTYHVDLTSEVISLADCPDHTAFRIFAKGIVSENSKRYFLNQQRKEKAILHRQVYLDSFEYVIRLHQYYTLILDNNVIAMEDSLYALAPRFWAINYPVLKEIMQKSALQDKMKAMILMKISSYGFSHSEKRAYAFESVEYFINNVLVDIKKLNPNFPYAGEGQTYTFREGCKKFAGELFNFASDHYSSNLSLNEVERNFLYRNVYSGLLNDALVRREVAANYDTAAFIKSYLSVTPQEEIDDIFDMCSNFFRRDEVIEAAGRLAATNGVFYPTARITETLIRSGSDWESISIPKDKFYDMDYIRVLAQRIGADGIIFGSGYSGNRFFIDRIELDRIPKEFFIEFKEDISWSNVSCCKHMSLEFMKEHKTQLNFYYVQKSVSHYIDDELAQWIFDNQYNGGNNCNVTAILDSASLSMKFISANINNLITQSSSRSITAARTPVKLIDMVEILG